jgi:hypothetical protein
MQAIIHIFDRLEGKPTMKAEVKGEGHVVHPLIEIDNRIGSIETRGRDHDPGRKRGD